jgi:hypothetical protein
MYSLNITEPDGTQTKHGYTDLSRALGQLSFTRSMWKGQHVHATLTYQG